MVEFFLFLLAVIFAMISLKLLTHKSGNHDVDLFLKIVGIILLGPSLWIILESLKIIK
tara:strand:- start:627 stop:800 length:174 start_codon:yes stop_codon:yes gene_type:complete